MIYAAWMDDLGAFVTTGWPLVGPFVGVLVGATVSGFAQYRAVVRQHNYERVSTLSIARQNLYFDALDASSDLLQGFHRIFSVTLGQDPKAAELFPWTPEDKAERDVQAGQALADLGPLFERTARIEHRIKAIGAVPVGHAAEGLNRIVSDYVQKMNDDLPIMRADGVRQFVSEYDEAMALLGSTVRLDLAVEAVVRAGKKR